MAKVSFENLEKAKVLAALYNGAKPSSTDIASYDPNPMSVSEAKQLTFNRNNFDYIKGRILLIIFVGNTFNSKLYNKHNGVDSAEKIIESLKETGDANNPLISNLHKKNVDSAISEIKQSC